MARNMFDYAATRQGTIGNGVASRGAAEKIIQHGKGGTVNDFEDFRASSNIHDLLEKSETEGVSEWDLQNLTPNDLVFAERSRRNNGIPQ